MNTVKLKVKNRKDFLSADKLTAISSEGTVFNIGDKVIHEGDDLYREELIKKFTIDRETNDVLAHSKLGTGRISFLYFKKIKKIM